MNRNSGSHFYNNKFTTNITTMGCSASFDTPYAVRRYGEKFATLYIQHVLNHTTANMHIISKLFHLILFLKPNGHDLMYVENIHKITCVRINNHYNKNFPYTVNMDNMHEFNGELALLLCYITHDIHYLDVYPPKLINFNIDCPILNQYTKKQAIIELAIQQQKLIDYVPKTIEYWKTEIRRIEQHIANNDNAMELEENCHRIAQIHDENIILHKQLDDFKNKVKTSELECNQTNAVNANIAKLQRLCKILVCEKLTDSNVAIQDNVAVEERQQPVIASETKVEVVAETVFPMVPTAIPIVYPTAPTNVPITVAYVQQMESLA